MSLAILSALIRHELLRLWRAPGFVLPTLLFPVLFFAMFAVPHAGEQIGGVEAGAYLLVSYACFAVTSVGLFAFGVSVAAERALGWNRLLRTTPVAQASYLLSRFVVATVFAACSLALLFAFAVLTTAVGIRAELLGGLMLRVLPGVVTFSALGLAIGHLCTANAAAAVANLVFLPLAFASGLFVPLEHLPLLLQRLAPFLPSYHLGVLGWSLLDGHAAPNLGSSLAALGGFTILFVLLALWASRRDQARQFA